MASKKLFLNSADITECLELIDTLPDKIFIDDKHRLKVRLVIESILDNNRQHFGEDKEFHFTISERFNRIHISIEVAGDCYDSTFAPELTDEEKEMLSIHFYGTFSSKPSFRYDHSINKIRLTLKKAKAVEPAAKMGIGIMAGFLFSALGFLSPNVFRNVFLPICNQLSNIILGLIKMSVTPVIFLMVINSITECGSVYK